MSIWGTRVYFCLHGLAPVESPFLSPFSPSICLVHFFCELPKVQVCFPVRMSTLHCNTRVVMLFYLLLYNQVFEYWWIIPVEKMLNKWWMAEQYKCGGWKHHKQTEVEKKENFQVRTSKGWQSSLPVFRKKRITSRPFFQEKYPREFSPGVDPGSRSLMNHKQRQ